MKVRAPTPDDRAITTVPVAAGLDGFGGCDFSVPAGGAGAGCVIAAISALTAANVAAASSETGSSGAGCASETSPGAA
jgi:hypothetical protein